VERSEVRQAERPAPARFQAALQSLKQTHIRPEVHLAEAPAPRRVAPYAIAIDGEVGDENAPDAQGTLVVLYDPQGQDNWDGQFRLVSYMEVEVDRAEACDPMLPGVAWTWVTDAIGQGGHDDRPAHNLSGSVSLVSTTSFGDEGEKPDKSIVQIRASWSPENEQVGPHLGMWAEMLAMAGGLERLPSEVTSLEEHRQMYHDGSDQADQHNEPALYAVPGNPGLANISPRHPSLHHVQHPLNTTG